ncbi:MAG TPA: thioredoxin domain-containing protein [Azospirillaceae bacterium]|nr:thioredoxin domain-containing protein [Azospirillaceae bacterium]
MAGNLLGRETSPYLLQHKDNPVHWMPWGPEALKRAQQENKPILLSIGYAACHWCHVMAHESFEDNEIAALMNDLFVSIKVDREERPDLDQIYQSSLALLGQQGGWPLTMFLTPDGEPFWGGTYFPPTSRWGRPGFPDVLRSVSATYHGEPDKIGRNVTTLRAALTKLAESRPPATVDPDTIDQIAERLVREVDPFHGGIGEAPKFPQVPLFELLWRAWLRNGRAPFKTAVLTTLTAMSQGGIYDHLGGGFARYATDAQWLVPHFEKMLYDNAQLIDLLTLVWQDTGDALFAQRVRETVDWTLREMIAEGSTAFASTLDADSEGEEGRFYVWTEEEIDRLLGADSLLFKLAYDVMPQGNWEGRTILNRRLATALGDATYEAKLADLRHILWREREKRVRPGWDDKVLADWNGLMIAALANAGMVFHVKQWIEAAERAFAFIHDTMTIDGRLRHSWRHGQARHAATLDDHANMARAALTLYEATGQDRYVEHAKAWTGVLDRHYRDATAGGYFFTADDAEALIVRTKNAHDNATPSGNGTMVGVLARLYYLTGDAAWRKQAEAIVDAFSGELSRNFFPLPTLLNNTELLQNALQVVITGPPDDPATKALRDTVLRRALPTRILTVLAPGADLPADHPAHGKGPVGGRPAAYVCRGLACSTPVTEVGALETELSRR